MEYKVGQIVKPNSGWNGILHLSHWHCNEEYILVGYHCDPMGIKKLLGGDIHTDMFVITSDIGLYSISPRSLDLYFKVTGECDMEVYRMVYG